MKRITLIKPDDFHVHLRDGDLLNLVVSHSAQYFERILVMPNLNPPIETVGQAWAYRERILRAWGEKTGEDFNPLMTLYLTTHTTKETVQEVARSPEVMGFKLYPAYATTQSQFGVGDVEIIFPILEVMEKMGVYLMIHGEDPSVDIFDREKVFIDQTLSKIIRKFPALKITLEHITTAEAVDFIRSAPPHVKAGVTPHHLLLDRNDLLAGGLKPHHYCMPILKRNTHREYLLKAVLAGEEKFFLGTDSAPHWEKDKLTCGCAGIYSAPVALSICADIFDSHGRLDNLENFTSVFGARHYGLPPNPNRITLVKKPQQVPDHYGLSEAPGKGEGGGSMEERLIPLKGGETLPWQIEAG